jgi:hypothetical protein
MAVEIALPVIRKDAWQCGMTPFYICAGAMQYPGAVGTNWIGRVSLHTTPPYSWLPGWAFKDDDNNICLLELHDRIPGGAMNVIKPLLTNPPHTIENYATTPGARIELGSISMLCHTTVTISRVRIPAGLPTDLSARFCQAGLRNHEIYFTDIEAVDWRSLVDHVRAFIAIGTGRDLQHLCEVALPRLVRAGIIDDPEMVALLALVPATGAVL